MNNLQWAEELPEQCPPQGAYQPNEEEFYRVVKGDPAKEEDFFSQRELNQVKKFKEVSECVARAVSVFTNPECARRLLKLPKFKGGCVAKVKLNPRDGMVKQTGNRPEHFSWWRTTDFEIGSAQII